MAYVNLTTYSFCILILEKGIVIYGQIISSHLYVCLKKELAILNSSE